MNKDRRSAESYLHEDELHSVKAYNELITKTRKNVRFYINQRKLIMNRGFERRAKQEKASTTTHSV